MNDIQTQGVQMTETEKLQKIKEELKKEFGKLHYNIIAYSIIDKIFKENE